MNAFERFMITFSFIFIIVAFIFSPIKQPIEDVSYNFTCNNTCIYNHTISDLEFAQEVVNRFSENNKLTNVSETIPTDEIYACEQASNDLKEIGEQLGIDIELETGFIHEENGGHEWNKICFDYDISRNQLINFKEYGERK